MTNNYAVASFNIRLSAVDDGENSWQYRKGHVRDMIRYYGWDVFGMQEVCRDQFDYLAELEEYAFEGGARDESPHTEYGPIFYKKDLFEKEDSGMFWLSATPDTLSKGWDADCHRICTWVKLKDKRNGNVFAFLNTHLDHRGEKARSNSAELINRWIKENLDDIPVVLVGDFNTLPSEQPYQEFSKQLIDTRAITKDAHYGPRGTFTDFQYDIAFEDVKEIDYIFVSRQVNVLKTRTIVDSIDRKFPSDHFPVVATVEF